MKAVYYDSFGGADVLKYGDLPNPTPGPREVLIEVAAAGVNPVDWKVREGWFAPYFKTIFPVVPGWDVAGRIRAVGEDVSDWQTGDAVMSYCRTETVHAGCYAEYVSVPATTLAPKPKTPHLMKPRAFPCVR